MNKGWYKSKELLVSIIIAEFAGVVGSVFTASSIPTWYAGLEKPVWSPPSWIFSPVWIVLYALMGVAAYLVWKARHEKPEAEGALVLYGIHLFFNSLWGIIFFGMRNLGVAFAEIVILWILIFLTMIAFFRVNRPAGLVFIPYLLWVLFAMALNFTLWKLSF